MKKLLILGMTGLMLLATVACGSSAAKTSAEVTTAKAEANQTVDAFGVIKSTDAKNIVLDFNATVNQVSVKEGQKVKMGDELVVLNLSEYLAQLKNKELDLVSANSEVQRLIPKNGADADVKKLANDIQTAQQLYNKSVTELASKEELLKSGSISQSDYDDFKKTVDARKKDMDDLIFTLDSTKSSKVKELQQAQVRADSLTAEIAAMKEKLGKSYIKDNKIVCDVNSGVVSDIGYIQGDILTASKPVLSLLNLDKLMVEANVNEEFIKDVKMGATATVTPLADKSKTYKGKVTYISDKAVTNNGETTIAVQISLDKTDDFLIPSFNVEVKIDR